MSPERNVSLQLENRISQGLSFTPGHGVLTLFGYGIQVRVDRGHLLVEDGIGADRHIVRFPRVAHKLKRVIVIGSDGLVSLAALRWLADQKVAFVMLDRDGTVLCSTGPVRPSDARLRRAQAVATQTGADVAIARELISQKLAGQELVAREKLHDTAAAQEIADYRLALAEAETIDSIRSLESLGAAVYWAAWRDVQVLFPRKDLPRVPEHWCSFGTRKSPLSGSPRLAANPPNAMLNYFTQCSNQRLSWQRQLSDLIQVSVSFTWTPPLATAWHVTLWSLFDRMWTATCWIGLFNSR
jgi:CRISPR/Cas system-associated endonuclease Cas1